MLNKLQKLRNQKSDQGFTIIEVMIVLAIAGLIILIVFLAVPALQRNSRNTAIKSDASNVAGAVTTFESDNNGTAPTAVSGTGTVSLSATGATTETAKVQGSTVVKVITTVPTSPVTTGTVQVFFGQTCPTAQGGTGQTSTKAVSIFYTLENSSTGALECVDS